MHRSRSPIWVFTLLRNTQQTARTGFSDFAGLNEEDAFRFDYWMTGVAHAFENCHYQYRVGMLDEDRWQKHYADVRVLFENPGIAQWWRTTPPNMSPQFAALVEEISARRPRGRRGDRGLRPAACLESPSSSDSDCADADVRRSPSLRASTDQKRKR
jgi:hypothetical protein